jgi:hypothetical protein
MAVHFQRLLLLLLSAPIALGEFATKAVFVFLNVIVLSQYHGAQVGIAKPVAAGLFF